MAKRRQIPTLWVIVIVVFVTGLLLLLTTDFGRQIFIDRSVTNNQNDPGHAIGPETLFQVGIDAGGNWNCLLSTDFVNLTVNGQHIETTVDQWPGPGFTRTFTDGDLITSVGSILVLQIQIDEAAEVDHAIQGFLVTEENQIFVLSVPMCVP